MGTSPTDNNKWKASHPPPVVCRRIRSHLVQNAPVGENRSW
jgi:hypothetical protein